jgi:acyl-CoA synthetase (AMP-forming)/AMP-acid ligase II
MLPPALPRIADYAPWHAARTPDAEALVLGDTRISWANLAARVDALAGALLAAEVGVGDRVATLQTPCPDYFIAFLAASSIGAIWAGLNPKYRVGELLHVVTDCTPRVLLTRLSIGERRYDSEVAALRATGIAVTVGYDGSGDGIIAHDDFIAAGAGITADALAARRASVGGRQACLLVYTSGSTGTPKGAVLHQQGIVDFSLAQNRIWPLTPNRVLNYFPINHVGCTIDIATPAYVAGGTIVFLEQFDPDASLAVMARERITMWGSPPAVFTLQLAAYDRQPVDLSAVQLIVWEGAAIAEDSFDRLWDFGVPMATNYGMTETTSAITCTPPSRDRDELLNTVGPAFPGVAIRLVDGAGDPVAPGTPGEVMPLSRFNFLGYWQRPEATAAAFDAAGHFHTGDLAVCRPDGRYRIVGRLKEMYKSGGYNVYPREVEAVLEAHPAVIEAVVVAVPDPLWQEVGVAFVTLQAPATPEELTVWARERLANYKIPKRLHIEAEMPLLPIGKIDRTSLKNRAVAGG